MNWRNSQHYDYVQTLNGAQWAWEYLRRNPGYQSDWRWFNDAWQQLEAAYGAPPHRDMQRWRADPKAWRSRAEIDGCDDRGCVSDGERLAIECWMGARWGFYKFPMNPQLRAEDPEWDLAWRELETDAVLLDAPDTDYFDADTHKVALGFDLAQPLGPQFDDARRLLAVLQRQYRLAGMVMQTVANLWQQWLCGLRLLDADSEGATDKEIMETLGLDAVGLSALRHTAHDLMQSGYRQLAAMK